MLVTLAHSGLANVDSTGDMQLLHIRSLTVNRFASIESTHLDGFLLPLGTYIAPRDIGLHGAIGWEILWARQGVLRGRDGHLWAHGHRWARDAPTRHF